MISAHLEVVDAIFPTMFNCPIKTGISSVEKLKNFSEGG